MSSPITSYIQTPPFKEQTSFILQLPEPFVEKLFAEMGHKEGCKVVLLCRAHLMKFSGDNYWQATYFTLFKTHSIPVGLTYFQASGPLQARVADFLSYDAETPLAQEYKSTSLGTLILQDRSQRCDAIRNSIEEKLQQMPPEDQNLVYWHLGEQIVEYTDDLENPVKSSQFEEYGREHAHDNPLRLIDAVETISDLQGREQIQNYQNRILFGDNVYLGNQIPPRRQLLFADLTSDSEAESSFSLED